MTSMFFHELQNGDEVNVVWAFEDEDETVGLQPQFEYEVYANGREITNELSEKDRAKIETEIAYCHRKQCEQNRLEADIARWENRDQ